MDKLQLLTRAEEQQLGREQEETLDALARLCYLKMHGYFMNKLTEIYAHLETNQNQPKVYLKTTFYDYDSAFIEWRQRAAKNIRQHEKSGKKEERKEGDEGFEDRYSGNEYVAYFRESIDAILGYERANSIRFVNQTTWASSIKAIEKAEETEREEKEGTKEGEKYSTIEGILHRMYLCRKAYDEMFDEYAKDLSAAEAILAKHPSIKGHKLKGRFQAMLESGLIRYKSGRLKCDNDVLKEEKHYLRALKRVQDKMIEHNLRLVYSMAKKYTGRGIEYNDLVGFGNFGLMKAVEMFDYRRGYKFSSYATWHVRQAMTRAIADHGKTIRLPVHVVENIGRVNKVTASLWEELKREPTDEEIAERAGITVKKLEELQTWSRDTVSLQGRVGDDSELGDFIPDKRHPSDELVITQEMRDKTRKVLESLTPREEKVMRMRFGIGEIDPDFPLQRQGEDFFVTRERIREIEEKALRTLGNRFRKRKLKTFLE